MIERNVFVVNEATRSCCGRPVANCTCKPRRWQPGEVAKLIVAAEARDRADYLPLPTMNDKEDYLECLQDSDPDDMESQDDCLDLLFNQDALPPPNTMSQIITMNRAESKKPKKSTVSDDDNDILPIPGV